MADDFALKLPVSIRRCQAPDLRALEWFGLHKTDRLVIANAFRRHCAGELLMLVADADGFPIGQVWIDFDRLALERTGILWALRVFPILRGRGIGTRLVAEAERHLRRRGYAVSRLGVEKDNPRARALYQRLGYRLIREEQQPFAYDEPDGRLASGVADLWILEKRLARAA